MNESDLRDLLPAERRLASARRRDMEERLMEQIEHEAKTGRRRYQLVAGAAAAVLLLVAGALAMSLGGDDEPDSTGMTQEGESEDRPGVRWAPVPDEVNAALERWYVYGGGERPYLPSETISCDLPPGTDNSNLLEAVGDEGQAPFSIDPGPLDVPLAELLTAADFVQACTGDEIAEAYDVDPGLLSPDDATACVTDQPYPTAVVALAGQSCEDVVTNSEVPLRPMTELDVAIINRMRALDLAAMAMPEVCVTLESAQAWLEALVDEEELAFEITVPSDEQLVDDAANVFNDTDVDPAGLCYYGIFNWNAPEAGAAVNALPPDTEGMYGEPVDITP